MTRRRHHDLVAWQEAIRLVKGVYELTARFPSGERFGLTSQMRRAAVSVPCNIAEGAARQSKREFRQFLIVARGSLSELETQLHIAAELGFCNPDCAISGLIDRVFALLAGLISASARAEE